ncbi:hypothetical protein CYFUS_009654 [Cystobacter fuscus]|uniref:Uncharacterized protein n=2 Tax=Cystobacter fuscus TaxID=43 RepID=A0A250JL22_9BACT|nr:hypothetical protein CYFUS_009654 [Cystobacter fuscus]
MRSSPLLAVLCLLGTTHAAASDYKCTGNRVEKAGVTQYTVRRSGMDVAIDKGGNPRGRAVRRGNGYDIEVNGLRVATLEDGVIYRGASRWASVADAQRLSDCPDPIAVTLWVLGQTGGL